MAFVIWGRRRSSRWCRKALVLACLLSLFLAVPKTASADEYQLFLTATNRDGTPVDDIRADEVVVESAGTACNVTRVQPGTQAIKIALLVDNSGDADNSLNALRDGLRSFIDTIPTPHEIGLFSIAGQVRRLVDFTTDREALTDRASSIFVERGTGAMFIDGLLETWDRRFSDEDSWPMFVMVAYDGTESSNSTQEKEFNEFADELRMRGATVHVVLIMNRGGAALQKSVSLFLTDATGGSYEAINAATALSDVLGRLATEIGKHFEQVKNRYRVVFDCDGVPDQLQAGVTRPAISVSLFADRRLEP